MALQGMAGYQGCNYQMRCHYNDAPCHTFSNGGPMCAFCVCVHMCVIKVWCQMTHIFLISSPDT